MAVALFEKATNESISTCHNFDHVLYRVVQFPECFTRGDYTPIFCLDRQAVEEWKEISGNDTEGLMRYKHPKKALYVFGKNAGMKMASKLLELLDGKHTIQTLTIDSPKNSVFWYNEAMAIILYDRWLKDEMAVEEKFS